MPTSATRLQTQMPDYREITTDTNPVCLFFHIFIPPTASLSLHSPDAMPYTNRGPYVYLKTAAGVMQCTSDGVFYLHCNNRRRLCGEWDKIPGCWKTFSNIILARFLCFCIYTVYKGWCHCLLISCERSLLNTELQSIDDWKIVSLQLRYLTTVFMVYDRHMALYLSNVLLTNAGKRTDK